MRTAMTWTAMILGWAGCASPAVEPSETGDSGSAPPACEGFEATPQTSTSSDPYAVPCPGGGTVEDLFAILRFVDTPGESCDLCTPGPLAVELGVVNLCSVDIEVTVSCPVSEWTLVRPDGTAVSAIIDCVPTETQYTFGSGETLWWSETLDADVPGAYQLDVVTNGGLGSERASFCVE